MLTEPINEVSVDVCLCAIICEWKGQLAIVYFMVANQNVVVNLWTLVCVLYLADLIGPEIYIIKNFFVIKISKNNT